MLRLLLSAFCIAGVFALPALAQETLPPTAAETGKAEPVDMPVAVTDEPPAFIDTAAFAERNLLSGSKLSPDGKQIASKMKLEGINYILLFDAESRQAVSKFQTGEKTSVDWFRWAGNDKLILAISQPGEFYGEDVRYTRLALVHVREGWVEMLGRRTNAVEGDNMIHLAEDGSYALVSVQRTVYEYPSVYRYELERDGKVKTVQEPRDGVWRWYADDAGVVRIGSGWRGNRLRIYYRANESDGLRLVAKLKEDDDEGKFWDVAQIISGSDQGYVLRENDAGRVGLHLFDYSTREIVETIYENPDWDVDSAWVRDGKLIAAFYTDERDRVVWFDDAYEKEFNALGRALGDRELWITSRADDNSRMLVWAGGPADPGALFVFTPQAKKLEFLANMRPRVDLESLSEPRSVSYSARDGTTIHGYLTLPRGREARKLPLIILPHGGPYGVRDSLVYNDEVQLLANRGYAVLQPNFRGSSGYGEAFFELGSGQIGRGMQDDLDDAMDWAVEEGIADKDRVCVVGGSYGGYAALWAVIRNPERYRCAASWAGVTDWDMMLKYDRRYFSRKAGKKWEARIQGDDEFDLDTVSPYRLAESLKRPVLLAHGTDDDNVPFKQFRKFRNAAKDAEVVPVELVIDDEGHSFSTPANEQAWYDALVAFLAEHNPADSRR